MKGALSAQRAMQGLEPKTKEFKIFRKEAEQNELVARHDEKLLYKKNPPKGIYSQYSSHLFVWLDINMRKSFKKSLLKSHNSLKLTFCTKKNPSV